MKTVALAMEMRQGKITYYRRHIVNLRSIAVAEQYRIVNNLLSTMQLKVKRYKNLKINFMTLNKGIRQVYC